MHILILLLQVSLATPNPADLLWSRGREQLTQGQYAEAERTLLAAVRAEPESNLKPTALGVMLNDLAEVYRHLGNYRQAEALYARSIAELKKFPEATRDLVLVLGNQGTMYRETGQAIRSTQSFEESLAIAKKARLAQDPLLAAILNGLAAATISAKGNLKKSQRLLEESLRIRETTLGPDHLDVSETLNNLGTVLFERKQYTQAESTLQRALTITELHLGADHPDVSVTLSNLGVLYFEDHRYEAAEQAFRRSLEIREKKLPLDHPTIATNLLHLARVMMSINRTSEAQDLLQRAVAIGNQRPQAVDSERVFTLEQYAAALRLNGYTSDAAAVEARAKWMRAELKYVVKALR